MLEYILESQTSKWKLVLSNGAFYFHISLCIQERYENESGDLKPAKYHNVHFVLDSFVEDTIHTYITATSCFLITLVTSLKPVWW